MSAKSCVLFDGTAFVVAFGAEEHVSVLIAVAVGAAATMMDAAPSLVPAVAAEVPAMNLDPNMADCSTRGPADMD